MSFTTHYFIYIDKATSALVSYCAHTLLEGVEPEAGSSEDLLVKEVSAEDLGELTLGEFFSTKKAVLSGEEFSYWVDKHSGLVCSISAMPKNDGSNTPYISMLDGLANSPFKTTSSSGIVLNSQAAGVLDGTGNGSFRIKITDGSITQGSVIVMPDGHQDFVPVVFGFDVEAGDF